MRFSVLAMLFASVFAAAPTIPPQEVPESLAEVPMALVMAYAPWCGHCVHAKPAFEEVESLVPTYLVDASTPEAEQFRSSYEVKGFPSFLLLEHGKLVDRYVGARTREAIEAYLAAKVSVLLTPPSFLQESAAEASEPEAPEAASESSDDPPAPPPPSDDDSDYKSAEEKHDEL